MDRYQRHNLRDCLLAQAKLCERIAEQATHESTAGEFRRMAQDCRAAAEETDRTT